jgi:hypothetical protein
MAAITHRSVTAATLALSLIALSALAVSACGDSGPKPIKLDAARLSAITALTSSQYATIKKVYVAAVAIDKVESKALTPAEAKVQLPIITKPYLDACAEGDGRDPLLGPLAATCPETASLAAGLVKVADCDVTARLLLGGGAKPAGKECFRGLAQARAGIASLVAANHVADRAVRLTHLPRGCKRALLISGAEYASYRHADLSLRLTQRALSPAAADADRTRAFEALIQVDKDAVPTAQQGLDRFRRNCH